MVKKEFVFGSCYKVCFLVYSCKSKTAVYQTQKDNDSDVYKCRKWTASSRLALFNE